MFAPPCEAELSSVPEMMPVAGSRVRPGGRPSAVKVSVSPLSTSSNWPEMSTGVMASPSLLAWSSRVTFGVSVGASLVPVTVTVSVAEEVPPSPSETV
ncbi:hemolysin-type calcium-binding repeat family 1 domain protein [Bordetella bronchiseptica]|nr:hemolysin-type calcium-binding repeat family 1 domain protein [Bordetella bronchiseptica]